MLTKPRFLLSLSKKLDSFTTAKITIMIIMIKIIVITMLIIMIIMIIKWNLEVVNQQRTLCVPKKKKTKWFYLYLCFFYRFLRSSIFTFVLFFLGVAIRFYIYIYIYTSLYSCVLSTVLRKSKFYIHTHIYIYTLSVHTRPLTTAWVCFFTLNFTPSQIIIAGIFWGAGTELLWTLYSFLLALFFFDICADLLMSTKRFI